MSSEPRAPASAARAAYRSPTAHSLSSSLSSAADVVRLAAEIEDLLLLVDDLGRSREEGLTLTDGFRASSGEDAVDVRGEIVAHCRSRAEAMAGDVLGALVGTVVAPKGGGGGVASLDLDQDGQAAVARVVELNLVVRLAGGGGGGVTGEVDDVIDRYGTFQRKALRFRAKPAIAAVAGLRRVAEETGRPFTELIRPSEDNGEGEDGQDGGRGAMTVEERRLQSQPHGRAATVVLGEASSLAHPLAMWRDSMPPLLEDEGAATGAAAVDVPTAVRQLCEKSLSTLHTEAQSLTKTLGEWFFEDHGISKWEELGLRGSTVLVDHQSHDLASLDRTIEEMSYLCQVVARYLAFVDGILTPSDRNGDLSLHLSELSLRYSGLETALLQRNYQNALRLATPVEIVLGRGVHVPSVVEDSYYLGQNGIERAIGTRSERAVWTVGLSVCELWNPSMGGGVSQALLDGVGCDVKPVERREAPKSGGGRAEEPPTSVKRGNGGFANAFLAAFEENLGENPSPQKSNGGGTNPGRTSRWGSSDPDSKIARQLCALNGLHSASSACSSLSGLFASFLEDGNIDSASSSASMIQSARDEMASHATSYQKLLVEQARNLLEEWCGLVSLENSELTWRVARPSMPLTRLYQFILAENYELNSASFNRAENSDRLEMNLLKPLRECPLIRDILTGKADAEASMAVAQELSAQISTVVLGTILGEKKCFTEWGALLLGKESRCLQNLLCGMVLGEGGGASEDIGAEGDVMINTVTVINRFEKLSKATTILQLERPSDWSSFAYAIGNDVGGNLSAEDVEAIMMLRVDFSQDAIKAVCQSLKQK